MSKETERNNFDETRNKSEDDFEKNLTYISAGALGLLGEKVNKKIINLVLFILLYSNITFGQSFKGQLIKNIDGKYKYILNCDDELIVKGTTSVIKMKRTTDNNVLYEVNVDTVLWGGDSLAQNCKKIYILFHAKDSAIINSSNLLILKSLNYFINNRYIKCEYYSLVGIIPSSNGLKIESCILPGSQQISNKNILVKFSKSKTKVIRDEFEKVIIKRRRKDCP